MSHAQLRIAGPDPAHRLKFELVSNQIVRIGRSPQSGLEIPWDRSISREHADVVLDGDRFTIRVLPEARNSIHFEEEKHRELTLPLGASFRIGSTQFEVLSLTEKANRQTTLIDVPEQQVYVDQVYSEDELRQTHFGCAVQQIEALARLPQLISSSKTDDELIATLPGLLLEAIPHAGAVAVAHYDPSCLPISQTSQEDFPVPKLANVELRDGFTGTFRLSRRLLREVLNNQTARMQIWNGGDAASCFTWTAGLDWAFGTPVLGTSNRGWCFYVAGQGARNGSVLVDEDDLKGDVRFTELVAQFIASIREVRLLESQKSQLSSFLSPSVIQTLSNSDSQLALAPSERDITVLFCDVRGFCEHVEALADDLMQVLTTVREALGVMAGGILYHNGTIADFQGDAALGFWGWPMELENGPLPACHAALEICDQFRRARKRAGDPLAGISISMGIAHGRGIAGEIGTLSQAKVGVFGPVVNRGSRLQGMTRQFDVPICVDEATAEYAQTFLSQDEARIRTLARVRPLGMNSPVTVYGLIPAISEAETMTPEMMACHDDAVTCVIEERWNEAVQLLDQLPSDDGPATFLRSFLQENQLVPPTGWNGAIPLCYK